MQASALFEGFNYMGFSGGKLILSARNIVVVGAAAAGVLLALVLRNRRKELSRVDDYSTKSREGMSLCSPSKKHGNIKARFLVLALSSGLSDAFQQPHRRHGRPLFEPTFAAEVDSPNPGWVPTSKQRPPFKSEERVQLDPKDLTSCYPLMISAYVPRPIALVSSMSAQGVGNVAPFSYSGVVSHDPPIIAVSVCRVGDKTKDTHNNIVATKEFVVNVISGVFDHLNAR